MKKQLGHLKDKLNDISKRNRSIRLLRLYNKWNMDLFDLDKVSSDGGDALVDQIVDQKEKVQLLKVNVADEEKLAIRSRLTTLFRNMKSIEEETGMYDFYLGYPFLTGTMLDGTYFQAPLFLYPVRLERKDSSNQNWELHKEDGDPQLNRSLLLALKKINGINFSESMFDEASDIAKKRDHNEWIKWLSTYDFNVSSATESVEQFQSYKSDELPQYPQGTMVLKSFAILGNFPQGNSSLLRDYEELMELSDETVLGLSQEILDAEEVASTEHVLPSGEGEIAQAQTVEEKDRFYLMPTDGSQEEILEEARHRKGLVIHGPPGTGKSQVIVNLITDAISRRKKVLVVCQKRAALDVVYQRLESLQVADHVALVHDEKHDRQSLYTKISQLIDSADTYQAQVQSELVNVSAKLESREETLNNIAKGLFEFQSFGYRAYDLYGLAKSADELEHMLDLHQMIDQVDKGNLDELLAEIYTYGEYVGRYGSETYPLVKRHSFSALEIKDRMTITDTLKKLIDKAKQSFQYIESLEQEKMTPAYTWLIRAKLEKIYDDLDPTQKRSLQQLRLWWWTSFTGKRMIEELIEGNKFQGLSSTEWPHIRESLRVLYDLAVVSEKMVTELDQLKQYIHQDEIERLKKRVSEGKIPLQELERMSEYVLQDFEELRQMDRMYEKASPLVQKLIDMAIENVPKMEGRSLAEHWVETIKHSVYLHWIDRIEKKYSDLPSISTDQFERLRNSFSQLIEEKREVAQRVLSNQFVQRVREVKEEHSKAIKELNHQVSKKRMRWPVRKLVNEFSSKGLTDILPVWLTSPEMVSSIFPLSEGLFDLVIFDEASQCTVENGIPAIYRAKQVIVAGDEMQLPPSNLFRGSLADEEEPEFDVDESQSLLNLAKRRFPEKLLQWHYRSKSEELINFSNHAFYHGHVQIAPNVQPLRQPAAIQWKKVKGIWINQCNELEAHEVVELLKQQLIKNPEQTIGMITFNAKQQDKILDVIDQKTQEDPEFGSVYLQVMSREVDQRVFVKNIENVQGDERDVIIFSIGYAKNEEGKVYNRFGSLNQQGGENRLNVAVSRAKEQVYVVSSIEPHELQVASSKNQGPRLLKAYLEYAQVVSNVEQEQVNHVLKQVNEHMNVQKQEGVVQFDSPFEKEVYQQLKAIGYEVNTQIGLSGYRIDLAVVHPNDPQKYILGIECDGAMYHSSKNAKERDVYRQKFIESRGWTLTRIWSRNWWKNPSAEIERIDQMIRHIILQEQKVHKVKSMLISNL